MRHADDDPVLFGYSSDHNVSFGDRHGEERDVTWGEWRLMNTTERAQVMQDYVNELVEVFIVGDEA